MGVEDRLRALEARVSDVEFGVAKAHADIKEDRVWMAKMEAEMTDAHAHLRELRTEMAKSSPRRLLVLAMIALAIWILLA
jgi:uncharacterized coiled-coil protein SlyX